MLHSYVMSAGGSALITQRPIHHDHLSSGKGTREARILLALNFSCPEVTSAHILLAEASHGAMPTAKTTRKRSLFLGLEEGEPDTFVEQQKWLPQTPSVQGTAQKRL